MSVEIPQQDVMIVTGMSGAGRSTVGNALEDLGWYVVDNLPPQMLKPLVELAGRAGTSLPKIAAVVDVRGGDFFSELRDILQTFGTGPRLRVLFLEATDAALVRRFEQVRRPHPLQGNGTLLDGIAAERARMIEIREASDLVIDTSELNIHQLATTITEQFSGADDAGVRVTVMSGGVRPRVRPGPRPGARGGTSGRTRDTLRSLSAVPAASTARSPSPRSSPASSAPFPASLSAPSTATSAGSRAPISSRE